MSDRPCRFCAAQRFELEECEMTHRADIDDLTPLATRLASIFQQRNPTDAQIGMFMGDADAIFGDFDPKPDVWRVRKLPLNDYDEFVMRFRINDVTYVVPDGEGYNEPVRLTEYRSWAVSAHE